MNRRQILRLFPSLALPALMRAEHFDYPWKLGIITDEVSPNLEKTLHEFYPKYGLQWAEIRDLQLGGKNVYVYRSASNEELKEVRKQLDDAGVKLSVLDTAVYKIALPGTHPVGQNSINERNPESGAYGRQMDDLKRGCDAAQMLGTTKVRIFAFLRVADPNAIFDRIVDELGKAIQVAKQQGAILALENEFSCNIATGTESARLFRAISDRTLMHNWDPGNCLEAGEQPYPKAWDQLDHSRIIHIHLKDSDGHRWLPMGSGKIDYIGQFKALKQMKYNGTMSLETHYRNAQKDPFTSSVESMDGLVKILREV